MNTQTHVLVGWLVSRKLLGKSPNGASGSGSAGVWIAAITAAIIPDAWMIIMLVIETMAGSTSDYIWRVAYFSQPWLTVDAIFNSLPLYASVAIVGLVVRQPWLIAFGISASLHIVLDLPVHAEDAHAHFWPLTMWKFHSPISYWETDKGALYVLALETVMGVVGCFWLWRAFPQWPWRTVTAFLLALFVLFGVMGLYWSFNGAPWDAP